VRVGLLRYGDVPSAIAMNGSASRPSSATMKGMRCGACQQCSAKGLGITVPSTLVVAADEVIE
jgi:hypothetical protein